MNRRSLHLISSLLAWTAVLIWATGVFYLSSLSGPEVGRLNIFKLWDKAAHFSAFAIGAALVALALAHSTHWNWKKITLLTSLAISLFGALDEWHQLYTPKRSGADLADWGADTLGAITAVILTRFVYARFQRKTSPAPARD